MGQVFIVGHNGSTVDFRSLYFKLFAAVADAVEELEQGQADMARRRLIAAQQAAEEAYLSGETEDPSE